VRGAKGGRAEQRLNNAVKAGRLGIIDDPSDADSID